MTKLALAALLALCLAVPAAAQRGPVPAPTLPGRACATPLGVCWAHPSAAPGTPTTGVMWMPPPSIVTDSSVTVLPSGTQMTRLPRA